MQAQKKILFAPLDWGLGHATRSVPLIRKALSEGHEVLLASNGRSAAFLKDYFPHLDAITDIPDYRIHYPENGNMTAHFLRDARRILKVIDDEHHWLLHIAKEHHLDEVYSDNRYGLWHPSIPCHLITHQIFIRAPWPASSFLLAMVKKYARRFTSVLVPDYADENNLSGALSHGNHGLKNLEYIGPLSRFNEEEKRTDLPVYDLMAIISGPEPLRSAFQRSIEEVFYASEKKALIVCGMTDTDFDIQRGRIRLLAHAHDDALAHWIRQVSCIVCRPGYSSIMDLEVLKKKAILIPTPGQSEQEYLAHYHAKKNDHISIQEKDIARDLGREIESALASAVYA